MIQTPAQAGNRASKPEHYLAVVGAQPRMECSLASAANMTTYTPAILNVLPGQARVRSGRQAVTGSAATAFNHREVQQKGLRDHISPICTLSQNGYGATSSQAHAYMRWEQSYVSQHTPDGWWTPDQPPQRYGAAILACPQMAPYEGGKA